MKQQHNLLALFVVLTVIVLVGLVGASAALAGNDHSATSSDPTCGGLRLDEFYACKNGAELPATSAGGVKSVAALPKVNSCGELRLDEFYACKNGGWQPAR